MTQSKLVKKKKTKPVEDKKNDKKSDIKQPPLPVDERVQAEINLREMIKQAHKIHKDYVTRSSTNSITPISSMTSRRNIDKSKVSAGGSYGEVSIISENNKKKSKTSKAEKSSVSEVTSGKFRRKNLEKLLAKRKFSEESHKKQAIISRRSSDAFAMREREIMAIKRSSANFPVKKNESGKAVAREGAECFRKIENNDKGRMPFVSLEIIDKMKCQDWNGSTSPKKNLLRQKRRTEHEHFGTNITKTKKKKSEKKTEIKENSVNKKSNEKNGVIGTGKRQEAHHKKRNAKYENSASELTPISKETPCKKVLNRTFKPKSGVSSPKSVSSNFDSNLSTFSGAGDPFSSNASHSYFSTDSDTSKIDKKFMQVLREVTEKNLDIDIDIKLKRESFSTEQSKQGINSDENKFQELQQSELEQRLIKRINSLERKLENVNTTTEIAGEEKEGQENPGGSVDVSNSTSPVVEQLWMKESTFPVNYSGVSLTINADQTQKENLETESSRKLKKDDSNRDVEHEKKGVQDLSQEASASNPEEEVINKDVLTSEVKPMSVSASKERTETPNVSGKKDATQNKPIETWSIIKRLEKAFQTLGLNLEDIESSDESSSAKKKQPLMKKHVSSGKDKKNWHKIETVKKVQNTEKSLSSKKKSKKLDNSDVETCNQYKVESNGSGDKNMEYKKVRNSKKVEDLKGECGTSRNKTNTVIHCTSASRKFQKNGNEEVTGGLSESLKAIQSKSCSVHKMSESRIHSSTKPVIVNSALTEGIITDFGGKRYFEQEKIFKNVHADDLLLSRSSIKRRSEYSLSASCSLSSMSEEDDFKHHKRKKKRPSYSMESNTSNQDRRKIGTSGTGDATTQAVLQLLDRSIDWQIQKNRFNQSLEIFNPKLSNAKEILHIEERSNELELEEIRERHKQIISEIKNSLNEIKKQHNLFCQLQTQTKKFYKDCHVKRKLIAAYLRDVEQTYESRKARESFYGNNCKYRRALSTDNYCYERKSKIRNKISDYDLELRSLKKDEMGRLKKKLRRNTSVISNRCESVLSITATMDETSSCEMSSIAMENTSADFSSTDTEDSFRTVTTSINPAQQKARYIVQRKKIPQMLSLEWNRMTEKPSWHDESIKQTPHYFVQLVQELNRIIQAKHNLDDLIVKASASSNNSSFSGKAKGSASSNTSAYNASKHQNNRTEETSKATSLGYKNSFSNTSGKGGSKQHKSKGKGTKKFGREKPECDGEISSVRSIPFSQADPGGSSMDSITDREQEIVISESFPNQTDVDSLRPGNCPHSVKHEELRYRKGDPSFQNQTELLKCLDEHNRQCRGKTPEEERAYKRKMELERILRADEKIIKRSTHFKKDSDGHALDVDSYHSGKEKHSVYGKHRQESIIIDHNRGEENEESQTVLGHASRHTGVGRNRKTPHEYLKMDMKSESSFQSDKKSQGIWKKMGKKGRDVPDQFDGVPVNYVEISLNNPESSVRISRDADCQTDNAHDYEDIGDIYLWDSESNHSTQSSHHSSVTVRKH